MPTPQASAHHHDNSHRTVRRVISAASTSGLPAPGARRSRSPCGCQGRRPHPTQSRRRSRAPSSGPLDPDGPPATLRPWAPRPATLPSAPTDERLSQTLDQFSGSGQICIRCRPLVRGGSGCGGVDVESLGVRGADVFEGGGCSHAEDAHQVQRIGGVGGFVEEPVDA